ncbi:MAG: hypothetical protein AABX08_04475 [Nanoarchaeota archaeon]
MKRYFFIIVAFLLFLYPVLSHGDEIDIHQELYNLQLNFIYIGGLIIVGITLVSIYFEKKLKKYKIYLFLGIVISTVIVTIFLASSTIYLNVLSETKGPVHWHADFQIWNCGQKVDIVDPKGFANRVGTSVFHEHGDNRIHIEGVVVDEKEVNLDRFFHVLGGEMHSDRFVLPTEEGLLTINNGGLCKEEPGEIQAFVYRTKNNKYYQEKITNLEEYTPSPYQNVPPGDCIIIEFDSEIKERTENICETYKIAIERGDIIGS